MNKILYILVVIIANSCGNEHPSKTTINNDGSSTSLIVLGTVQDAGSPQIGCNKECCKHLFEHPDKDRQVVSLGLYDRDHGKRYLFEATPDLPKQMKALKNYGVSSDQEIADGVFLTHAHIGHYTGLMYLGKEAINADKIPVYAMPRMLEFLKTNGPWSQLVTSENILLKPIENETRIVLTPNIAIIPILVPHRDEYSETVGYKIKGPRKSALFIPDIDKWEKWDKSIIEEIKKVDYVFIDATFFSGAEINNRDISQIPHPFIIESMNKFESLNKSEKQKVVFIHFNHTNPVLNPQSEETKEIMKNGFRIARINDVFEL